MKALVVIVDGMRPDALVKTENAKFILENSKYTLNARTVTPSVTLPCHMSLFHSVDPSRHGTTTNVFTPNVRPINGLCEVLLNAKKTSAFFYNWEEIRDLSRPNSLAFSYFCKGRLYGYDKAKDIITDAAVDFLTKNEIDFTFLYFGYTDIAGHNHGWMSEQYMKSVSKALSCVEKLQNSISDEYTIILLADHGGHDRSHGSDMPEDMTIPILFCGKPFEKGKELEGDVSIKDVAVTIAKLLDVPPAKEWEGKALI